MARVDHERLKELFSAFGPVSIRRMFGGAGVFAEEIMFALISDGDLYFKADEETIPAFHAEGAGPFVYGARGRRVVMSYWRMPERLLDDPDELAQWARVARAAVERSGRKRPAPAKRKTKKRLAVPRKKRTR